MNLFESVQYLIKIVDKQAHMNFTFCIHVFNQAIPCAHWVLADMIWANWNFTVNLENFVFLREPVSRQIVDNQSFSEIQIWQWFLDRSLEQPGFVVVNFLVISLHQSASLETESSKKWIGSCKRLSLFEYCFGSGSVIPFIELSCGVYQSPST